LHEILGKQAEDLLVSLPDSDTFVAELTDAIIRSLHEGQCDTSAVAERMNISERTLHRRLKSKDKVFRTVLQEIRKSMVLEYLSDSKLSLSEIALLLGYGDQSSFTRAFSKWYDCSPLQYQKRYLN
jgi:AraC-like DNA-binding protein